MTSIKKKHSCIIGFGAPAKATTSLNYFGISKELDFVIEDNKLKHGKVIPGVNIPIYPKSKIKHKDVAILVLAWNYYDEIKKKNSLISKNFINIKSLEKYSLKY